MCYAPLGKNGNGFCLPLVRVFPCCRQNTRGASATDMLQFGINTHRKRRACARPIAITCRRRRRFLYDGLPVRRSCQENAFSTDEKAVVRCVQLLGEVVCPMSSNNDSVPDLVIPKTKRPRREELSAGSPVLNAASSLNYTVKLPTNCFKSVTNPESSSLA